MALTNTIIRESKPKEKPYKLFDGKGLHLLINPNNSKYWRVKYRFLGKEKLLSLGVYPEVTLSEARREMNKARKLLAKDIDPSFKNKEPLTPLFDRIDLYAIRGKHLQLLECAKSELISESYTLKKVDIALLGYDFAICDKETNQVHFYKVKNRGKET